MATGELHPLVERIAVPVSASATAVASTFVARAPFAGTVTSVTYVPVAAITGAATNNRALAVTNKLQDGSGSNVAASITYASGTNAVALKENAVTLSGTAANKVVSAGDILSVASTVNGSGLADPGGTLFITISRA